jgi:hypothetical protein
MRSFGLLEAGRAGCVRAIQPDFAGERPRFSGSYTLGCGQIKYARDFNCGKDGVKEIGERGRAVELARR